MQYTVRHTFNTDVDTFWDKVFFDEEFNRALFLEHLRFHHYKVLSFERDPDGAVRRKLDCAPPVEIPAVAKKVIGDATSYVEDGRFDPKAKKWHFNVIPAMGADKVKTSGQFWVEPRGDKKCERIATMDTTVSVFGVGKVVEAFIEKQTRGVYDQAAAFTNQWIQKHGL